jgi:hypothetical protein
VHALGDDVTASCGDSGGPRGAAAPEASAPSAAAAEHTMLELALAPGARTRSVAAAEVATSRRVEELSVSAEGAAGARAFLRRVAAGADLAPDDLHTPAGYKRLRLATAVRDEVALTLGLHPLQAGAFLLRMTELRMLPTPWLNAHFREPLYLKDVPVRVPDTRTEWERRFPELFTRKLAAEGYAAPVTPVSVMNPTHPEFVGAKK